MTYEEPVMRYRIMRHDDLPESHKAEYRAQGIDPDNIWSLIWSFNDLEAAEKCLAQHIEYAPSWATYKLVDNGSASTITRSVW